MPEVDSDNKEYLPTAKWMAQGAPVHPQNTQASILTPTTDHVEMPASPPPLPDPVEVSAAPPLQPNQVEMPATPSHNLNK